MFGLMLSLLMVGFVARPRLASSSSKACARHVFGSCGYADGLRLARCQYRPGSLVGGFGLQA